MQRTTDQKQAGMVELIGQLARGSAAKVIL